MPKGRIRNWLERKQEAQTGSWAQRRVEPPQEIPIKLEINESDVELLGTPGTEVY